MPPTQQHLANDAAYRRLKPIIDRIHPKGRFVAIHDACIVADGPALDELDALLRSKGIAPRDALVVQAGEDYPENVTLYSPMTRL